MEFEEKDAQEDYEKFIEDSANKRATDSKSLTDKEAAKASLRSDGKLLMLLFQSCAPKI